MSSRGYRLLVCCCPTFAIGLFLLLAAALDLAAGPAPPQAVTSAAQLISVPSPTGVTVTPTGTTGSSFYRYGVVAQVGGNYSVFALGTTSTGNSTLSGSNYNAISCSGPTGASKFFFYRISSPLSSSGYGLIGNASTCSFNDTGQTSDLTNPWNFTTIGIAGYSINNVIWLDGCLGVPSPKYACTIAGLRQAAKDANGYGSQAGVVMLPPMNSSGLGGTNGTGNPLGGIAFGGETFQIPSNIFVIGAGLHRYDVDINLCGGQGVTSCVNSTGVVTSASESGNIMTFNTNTAVPIEPGSYAIIANTNASYNSAANGLPNGWYVITTNASSGASTCTSFTAYNPVSGLSNFTGMGDVQNVPVAFDFPPGTFSSGVLNLTVENTSLSASLASQAISMESQGSSITQNNVVRDIEVLNGDGGPAALNETGIGVPNLGVNFQVTNNIFDDILYTQVGTPINIMKADWHNRFLNQRVIYTGSTAGVMAFQGAFYGDIVDGLVQNEGSSSTDIAFATSGRLNSVSLTVDLSASSSVLNESGATVGGNNYLIQNMGSSSLGTYVGTSYLKVLDYNAVLATVYSENHTGLRTASTSFGTNLSSQTVLASVPATGAVQVSMVAVVDAVGTSCTGATANTVTPTLSWTAPGGTPETSTGPVLSFTGNGTLDTASTTTMISLTAQGGSAITLTTSSTLGSSGCSPAPKYRIYAKAIS